MPVPNVQWKTPDDGQKNCPKHVEFRTKINLEISASVGFIVKKKCYDARSYGSKKKRLRIEYFNCSCVFNTFAAS